MADLTALEVNRLRKQPGTHRVSDNLYLQVRPSRKGGLRASWILRYYRDGRQTWMGLGKASVFALSEARERARKHRQLLADDLDPLVVKRQRITADKIEAAKSITFSECARKYVAAHEASWRNGKHAAQWRTTFEGSARAKAASAAINDLPVSEIDTALAIKVLEPIWKKTPETASRVRQRCEQVIDWAAARGYREKGSNPFMWRGHLDKLLPKPSKVKRVKHHPALPYAEMSHFMVELRGNKSISARALEFLILTACRTNEVISAVWDEINFADKAWTIPPDRMKAGKEHKVPLAPRAIEVLQALPREDGNPHLFIGGKKGAPLSNMAMLELMKGMRPGYVPHGFRSTFRDWAAERTNYANYVVEKALAHTVADKVEAAYRRGDLFEKRRRLMADWARFCASPTVKATDDNITPIRRKKAS